MFSDGYIDKEENEKLFDVLLNLCMTGNLVNKKLKFRESIFEFY